MMAFPPILHNRCYFSQDYANAAPLPIHNLDYLVEQHMCRWNTPASLTPRSVSPSVLETPLDSLLLEMDTFIFLLFFGGDELRPFASPEGITTQDGFQMGRHISSTADVGAAVWSICEDTRV